MKKFVMLSVMASTMIFAGGDIAPVEPVIETPMVEESIPGSFYLGLAYGYMNNTYTRTPTELDPKNFDESLSTVMLQAGYAFNEYVAIEGRYWAGLDDISVLNQVNQSYDLAGPDAWGIYVKPMYPVGAEVNVYALLGYAAAEYESAKLNYLDGFSWGLGLSYDVMDNVALFADYVSLYNDDKEITGGVNKAYELDTINVGVSYNF